ncbi:MAG: DUF5916 domain-containing protein [Bacteroidota bacterium]
MRIESSCFLLLASAILSIAQNIPRTTTISASQANESIKIDGRLDEKLWSTLDVGSGFYQNFPTDNQPAIDDTEFMVTYDDKFIIIGIKCYDGLEGDPIATTLRRDFEWVSNDNVSVYMDPYNDLTNGFAFQVTPNNVQREGLVLLNGSVQDDWDNKWFSKVYQGDGFWSVEMAIPFKSIRYNSVKEWNIQVLRNNQKRNERTSWTRVQQGFRMSNLTFSGKILWDEAPKKSSSNIVFIPYTVGSIARNIENRKPTDREVDAGFDAKVALSSSLNLDLTFNPDFSQVEVDRQVTNLQRFEIDFPERRQFFLENQDLFGQAGFVTTRPFFSRRIGIQGSGNTQRNVPIIAGARMSGKIGSKWRVGLLSMATDEHRTRDEISPAQNYSVAVIERQLFKRSRLSAMFVGRNNLGTAALDSFRVENERVVNQFGEEVKFADTLLTLSKHNYVFGLDYNLASVDGRWEGDFYYHRSDDPGTQDGKYSTGGFLRYQVPKFGWRVNLAKTGENHNAEIGFIPRIGITDYGVGVEWNSFTNGPIQQHGPALDFGGVTDDNWNRLDNEARFEYRFSFLNTASAEVTAGWDFVTLTRNFDPSGNDGIKLKKGEDFSWYRYRFSYRSDRRQNFIYRIDFSNGEFFNGTRLNIKGGFTFRFPPLIQVELNGEYNQVKLPDPYSGSDLYLIGTRFDFTLSNNLFFTSFVQFNTQADNLGHNSRFQWRFKPVSDLFIVYTDNYITPDFMPRNRSLVVKLNYWLNL